MQPSYPPRGPGAFGHPVTTVRPHRYVKPNPVSAGGKSTTIWVGKIASTVEPDTMKAILETCGNLRDWKPVIDPTKGFCFATFHEPQGVVLAQKLINGLEIDGQALIVKCNSATEAYISKYKADKAVLGLEPVSEGVEAAAREKLQNILSDRGTVEVAKDADTAALDFLQSLGETPTEQKVEVDAPKRSDRRKSLEEKIREKEELRAKQLKAALRLLDNHERDRLKLQERYEDRLRDLSQERQRQINADNEASELDYNVPFCERKYYQNSREQLARKRRKEQELESDLVEEHLVQRPSEKEKIEQEDRTVSLKETVETKQDELIRKEKQSRKKGLLFDEDEVSQRKRFMPIKYSVEELAVLKGDDRSVHQEKSSKKSAMGKIPKDLPGVQHYEIKWDIFDKAPQEIHEKIYGWIKKRIKDLMGEEELSFCEFVFSQLKSHQNAQNVLENLREVLDEDADSFVLKLFQVVIYETERISISQ